MCATRVKLLLIIIFIGLIIKRTSVHIHSSSRRGLVEQHVYLGSIVSASFSPIDLYKHHLIFLFIFEQHEIDNYVHPLSFF